jgi:hypothetical protein
MFYALINDAIAQLSFVGGCGGSHLVPYNSKKKTMIGAEQSSSADQRSTHQSGITDPAQVAYSIIHMRFIHFWFLTR